MWWPGVLTTDGPDIWHRQLRNLQVLTEPRALLTERRSQRCQPGNVEIIITSRFFSWNSVIFGDEMMISSGVTYSWGFPFFKYPTKNSTGSQTSIFFLRMLFGWTPWRFYPVLNLYQLFMLLTSRCETTSLLKTYRNNRWYNFNDATISWSNCRVKYSRISCRTDQASLASQRGHYPP